MNVESIDEAEALIRKFRKVIAAKKKVAEIGGEDGGDPSDFVLTDRGSGIDICLHDLKAEVLASINDVLNDQYEKITARLREI